MGSQGNVLRGESLVLVVSASTEPGTDGGQKPVVGEPPISMDDWVARIKGQIALHMELRFNKSRFSGKAPVDLLASQPAAQLAFGRSRKISKAIARWVRVTRCPIVDGGLNCNTHCANRCFEELGKKLRLLILVGQEVTCDQMTRRKICGTIQTEETFERFSRPQGIPCSYEFFRVKESVRKKCSPEPGPMPESKSRQAGASKSTVNVPPELPANDEDLYHLANRVCGALTEYFGVFDCGTEADDADPTKTGACAPFSPVDVLVAAETDAVLKRPWRCIPKILGRSRCRSVALRRVGRKRAVLPACSKGAATDLRGYQ